jgi:hypothetical protein
MAMLFQDDNPRAVRQPKTDRLVLGEYLKKAIQDPDVIEQAAEAHAILLRWADLDKSGQLGTLNESQLQGEFVEEVFEQALGYVGAMRPDRPWTVRREMLIAGQNADAVIAEPGAPQGPDDWRAVVELKGPGVHLDRDRSNRRTAVDQTWDYLVNTPPTCRWGIVSNVVSFRLYERSSTKRRYEHYTLQSLRDPDTFRRFFATFGAMGLLRGPRNTVPFMTRLLDDTLRRQRTVGDEIFKYYSDQRTKLIQSLTNPTTHNLPAEEAIEHAQRLFDRVVFIAFCEDRHLLPEKILAKTFSRGEGRRVRNPRWQAYRDLFRGVDEGWDQENIPAYNGGLFRKTALDDLDIDDEPITTFFQQLGEYNFADEVNLDVLGHLFEASITEIERYKETGFLLQPEDRVAEFAAMPQAAKRKRLGIYYTPPELTSRIVAYTVDELIAERFAAVDPDDADPHARLRVLQSLKIVDPACGSGAFLFQAYDTLEQRYGEVAQQLPDAERDAVLKVVPRHILNDNLYGVDLSPEAVEITQLALWIRSADRTQPLTNLAHNIRHGNSLVSDPAVSDDALDWQATFPEVFATSRDREGVGSAQPTSGRARQTSPSAIPLPDGRGSSRNVNGFDCVIGNPPWERIKLQEREFFSLPAPEIATASNAAKRRQMVAKLESDDPALYGRYTQAKQAAQDLLDHCRRSGDYPLCGRGDINTYAVFAELASKLVTPTGRVGLLVPSGIVSDKTTSAFFASIAETNRLIRLYDFENRTKQFFPDVDGRFKFCILNFGGEAIESTAADYVFFAHQVDELKDNKRHIALSGDDIKLLNPNTRTCPIFRTRRDAEITKGIYRHVPVLIDRNRKKTGNAWGVSFNRMFDQTNDAEHFREAAWLEEHGYTPDGNRWIGRGWVGRGQESPAESEQKSKPAAGATPDPVTYLPLYEAKMVQMFDHRAADVVVSDANWVRQGQTRSSTLVEHGNPEHVVSPRAWVEDAVVAAQADAETTHFLAYKDVTSPTNQRTMIAACLPRAGVVNSAPIVLPDQPPRRQLCLLANFNSFTWDFVVRQKISNVHLNFFIVEQIPTLPPDRYDEPCPWERGTGGGTGGGTLEDWIAERVLKLTCTAEDMLPLAEACGFTGGSFAEYGGKLHKWNDRERAELMAELDAAFFLLYGLDHDDAAYVLSTFKGIHQQGALFGRQSTADRILETYDALRLQSV